MIVASDEQLCRNGIPVMGFVSFRAVQARCLGIHVADVIA